MQFFVVYIREAHAIDSIVPLGGAPDPHMGGGDCPVIEDPKTFAERSEVAQACMTKLALEPIPALVDDMNDSLNRAFAAWPERLYVIGVDGRVVYRGDPGPMGFDPESFGEAIGELLD